MSGKPRDLAAAELWQASLARTRARRKAAKLQRSPARSRARRMSIGSLLAIAAAPAAACLCGIGVSSASAKTLTPTTTTTKHELVLRSGSEGRHVMLLQRALHVQVDGVFGPETQAAVERFQHRQGLQANGIVGAGTWSALRRRDAREIARRPGARPRKTGSGPHVAGEIEGTGATEGGGADRAEAAGRAEAGETAGGGVEAADGAAAAPGSAPSAPPAGAPGLAGTAGGSSFALCVANREAGNPGSTSAASVDWTIRDSPYEGGFQWLHATWLAQGGGRYAQRAVEATPAEQIAVFRAAEPSDPGAWPQSVPACGG